MLSEDELLGRMAQILRRDIGPSVEDGFAKTQAFMAGVILEKLSGQLRHAAAHDRDDRADAARLGTELGGALGPDDGEALRAAVATVGRAVEDPDVAVGPALNELVRQLYAERDRLGGERFTALLQRTRRTLRARLDRQLEYSA